MGKNTVRSVVYSPQIICRAFEYFATSRSLYHQLVNDYQLPSIRTLTQITSKVACVEYITFLKSVLHNLPVWQKRCVLLWDDHPDKLAHTVLSITIKCLYGGPEFLVKTLPVSNLNAEFLIEQSNPIIEAV